MKDPPLERSAQTVGVLLKGAQFGPTFGTRTRSSTGLAWGSVDDTGQARSFYDTFSWRLLLDYLRPNERIDLQRRFLAEAIPRGAKRVAFVGCGTGQVLRDSLPVAKRARFVGADYSCENIALARELFKHPRVEFLVHDILSAPLPGSFDVVVFPDSYEHIPRESRACLHQHVASMLGADGRVLLTCPTVAHQRAVRQSTRGLQPVDEDVDLADLERFAQEIDASVTYFSLIHVWNSYDYFHAELARNAGGEASLRKRGSTRLHRGRTLSERLIAVTAGQDGLLRAPARSLHIARALVMKALRRS